MSYPILLLLASVLLWSAPSLTHDQEFRLPDGTPFTAHLQGDEFLNWIETDDGAILLYSKARQRFEYAVIEEEELKASGVPYLPDRASSPQAPDKDTLYRIWMDKRYEAYLRRRGLPAQNPDHE